MLRTFTCKQCGKTFERQWYPSSEKDRKTFEYCSLDCASRARRKYKDIPCPICGKMFARHKAGAMKHCSWECRTIAQRNQIERVCEYCEKVFSVKVSIVHRIRGRGGTYCSLKCMRAASQKPEAYTMCHCVNCNQEFKVSKVQIRLRGGGKYCSNKCRFEYCRGENHPVWKNEKQARGKEYYGKNWKKQAAKARKRDNYICQVCGLRRKRPALTVHHIIPYRKFKDDYEAANKLNNLITVCRKHHGFIEAGTIPCPNPS